MEDDSHVWDARRYFKPVVSAFTDDSNHDSDPLVKVKAIIENLKSQLELLEPKDAELLLDALDIAEYDFGRPSPGGQMISFYNLGYVAGWLSHPYRHETIMNFMAKGAKSIQSEIQRKMPLTIKNESQKIAKTAVQEFAISAWKKPENNQMRVSDMAEYTWNFLCDQNGIDEFKKALPDKASGLIPWLREVAPEHAKKPGRPSYSKK